MSTSYVSVALRRLVRERARACCEYCVLPEAVALVPHEVDHIIAEKHGGPTEAENLALACSVCNKHKGSDLASIDPASGEIAPLYHPRRDRWFEHLSMDNGEIQGVTPVGRATVRLLQMNQQARVSERRVLLAAGVLRLPSEDQS